MTKLQSKLKLNKKTNQKKDEKTKQEQKTANLNPQTVDDQMKLQDTKSTG